jgi:type VI protein secretion system component Hcp
MRTIISLFLLAPIFSIAQTTSVYIKLSDSKGQQIIGESVLKGHEKWIQASTTTAGGKNNTQFSFTMPVSGASADLKRAMANGQALSIAEVHALVPNGGGAPLFSYTIMMQQVTVLSCTEAMGCNNVMNTAVSLQATRIGWTYYSQSRTGAATVSRKFGWDAAANAEWTNF